MTKTVFLQDSLPKPKVQKRNGATFATLTKVPHDKLRAEGRGFPVSNDETIVEIMAVFVLRYGNGSVGFIFSTMMGKCFFCLDFGLWIVDENGTHRDRLKEHMAI